MFADRAVAKGWQQGYLDGLRATEEQHCSKLHPIVWFGLGGVTGGAVAFIGAIVLSKAAEGMFQ